MTQEEKQLLLTDLCGRLPYVVICRYENEDYKSDNLLLINVCRVKTSDDFVYWDCYFEDDSQDVPIEIVKPYLRPMSSMTGKEWMEYCDACVEDEKSLVWAGKEYKFTSITHREEFLNSHHFDYRGLIEKGLALEAPEGMYDKTTCDNCPDKDFCSQSEYVMANCHKLK